MSDYLEIDEKKRSFEELNLEDLSYEGTEFYYDSNSQLDNPPLEKRELSVIVKKIPLTKSL